MCISLKEEVYKDYLVALFNHYDKINIITTNDFQLQEIEYQP
jgi:hypothetical protein